VLIKINSDDKDLELKHFRHAVQDPLLATYIEAKPGMKRVNMLPICPKCERIGLRDKGWTKDRIMTCPYCGYNGTTDIVYSEYKKDKNYL